MVTRPLSQLLMFGEFFGIKKFNSSDSSLNHKKPDVDWNKKKTATENKFHYIQESFIVLF